LHAELIEGVPACAGMTELGEGVEKQPAVYIVASKRHGTLYIGVTSDLCSRIAAHKAGSIEGFTKKYGVKQLVWFEYHDSMEAAIQREKKLKEWQRGWKITLIEKINPTWRDLFEETCGKFIP
jgi:putative endonuclease